MLRIETNWLSNGNCSKRFMEIFEVLGDYLGYKLEKMHLLIVNSNDFVSYLADVFQRLNMFNKQLNGTNKTFVGGRAMIIGFITFMELCQKHISDSEHTHSHKETSRHTDPSYTHKIYR